MTALQMLSPEKTHGTRLDGFKEYEQAHRQEFYDYPVSALEHHHNGFLNLTDVQHKPHFYPEVKNLLPAMWEAGYFMERESVRLIPLLDKYEAWKRNAKRGLEWREQRYAGKVQPIMTQVEEFNRIMIAFEHNQQSLEESEGNLQQFEQSVGRLKQEYKAGKEARNLTKKAHQESMVMLQSLQNTLNRLKQEVAEEGADAEDLLCSAQASHADLTALLASVKAKLEAMREEAVGLAGQVQIQQAKIDLYEFKVSPRWSILGLVTVIFVSSLLTWLGTKKEHK